MNIKSTTGHFITKIFHPNVSKSGEKFISPSSSSSSSSPPLPPSTTIPTTSTNIAQTKTVTPKKRVASSDKKLDKKQADKKRSMKRL
ncbi:4300_t:CDS:2 [Entrophospora sp. SA101]|nr:4300_t:CDS:2 [Entrophospora sp. SA101]